MASGNKPGGRRTPALETLSRNKPTLFAPAVVRGLAESEGHGSQILGAVDLETVSQMSLGNTGSWRYDLTEEGLKSTQQLPVNWSKFENHTFFQSAQAKVQVAFDKILNYYPFDGTQGEVETWMDGLTGFEKWVYDGFPKNRGYLFLTGSNPGDTVAGAGSWFKVYDAAGVAFSGISKDLTGQSRLDPGLESMTVETHLYLPAQTNSNSVILSKLSSSADLATQHGWTLVLSASTSATTASCQFLVSSGSYLQTTTFPVSKGSWQHLAVVWNRNPGVGKAYCYVDQVLVGTSSNALEFGTLNTRGTALLVGTGSQVRTSTFVPVTTLSGGLDDLRIWHKIRSTTDLQSSARKGLFAQPGLRGYWKFNEPSSISTRLVTDHSGYDLHGELGSQAVVLGTRAYNTSSLPVGPMTSELDTYSPVLFPGFVHITDFRSRLLLSGSRFDNANPNLITRLVPRHYLLEGQVQDSLSTEEGPLLTTYDAETEPRTGKLSSSQIMVLLLYTWAKYFDELKLFLDAFSNLLSMDYDSEDTVPDVFLQWFANYHGFHIPQLFRNSTVQQFVSGEDLGLDAATSETTLKEVQNQIWRRILVNFQEIIRSKGTVSGVKAFIRCLGVDPDETFRFREFGGPTKATLGTSRENRSEVGAMMSFLSGGLVKSSYLTASRTEPGDPGFVGPKNAQGFSTTVSDGLMTSGSWTWEGTYRFDQNSNYHQTQSLVRFYTTGSQTLNPEGALVANLVTFQPGTVALFLKPNHLATRPYLHLEVSGSTIMDGDRWYVSFGRRRAEEVASTVSASYFLRVAKQVHGTIQESWVTQSLFHDRLTSADEFNVWSVLTGSWNASGSWFQVGMTGSVNTPANTRPGSFLNDPVAVPQAAARWTQFSGRVAQVRFWSKALTDPEWQEHVRNPKSIGVEDPTTNWNFVGSQVSGSWERLRLDVSMDQPEVSSSAGGTMTLWDFSQNGRHLTGSGLLASSPYIFPERMWYSMVSTKFDEATNPEKVRVRSFQDFGLVQSSSCAEVAPVYALNPSETPVDDTRFSIDFSVVDALNQDMSLMFGGLGAWNNAIGAPELLFSGTYPELDTMREVYFNRLTGKVNLKGWYEFYKWFDMNTGWFIAQILPRKTKFLGVNFVLEPHALERSKMEYQWADHYVGDSNREGLRTPIYLSFYTTIGKRY